jgi:hypothetical protein
MSGPTRRFNPDELIGGADQPPTEAELADAFAAARVLEGYASADHVAPTEGFEDRVMAAIATEPAPRVVIRPASGVRGGRAAAFLAAVRDAWAIATRGGRPVAVRAQALGFLLVVGLVVGSLGTVTAVGVGSWLGNQSTPPPSVQPVVTVSPSPSPSTGPTVSPSPSTWPSPSPSIESPPATETLEPTDAPDATETPDESDDHGGGGEESTSETPDPTDSSEPDDTPKPGETLKPGETPDTSNEGSGSSGG